MKSAFLKFHIWTQFIRINPEIKFHLFLIDSTISKILNDPINISIIKPFPMEFFQFKNFKNHLYENI